MGQRAGRSREGHSGDFAAGDDSSDDQDEEEAIIWSDDDERAMDQAEAHMLQHLWGQEALVLRSLEFADD